jgi:CBS domain-containing protein
MEESQADRLAICDGGRFVGVITADDIVELDEILRHSTS